METGDSGDWRLENENDSVSVKVKVKVKVKVSVSVSVMNVNVIFLSVQRYKGAKSHVARATVTSRRLKKRKCNEHKSLKGKLKHNLAGHIIDPRTHECECDECEGECECECE